MTSHSPRLTEGSFSLSLILFLFGPFEWSLAFAVLVWILIFHFPPLFFLGWLITHLWLVITMWRVKKWSESEQMEEQRNHGI
jgi:hypothetical protein